MIQIISLKTNKANNYSKNKEVKNLLDRDVNASPKVQKAVLDILNNIRDKGHKAVVQYAQKFDGLTGTSLKVSSRELESQAGKCSPLVQKAIHKAIQNIRTFHKKQIDTSWMYNAPDRVRLGQIVRPLHRVGVYVPGGAGVYPSSVMMNVIPAQVAGVPEIVAVTPVSGKLDPSTAYALHQLGVSEVYKVGGAQAVGMLAYGTEKVQRVDKIVGPGNNFVALAKKEVFGRVDIDMIAGPSEILVMADEFADPDWVAADLLSQAEHGSGQEAAVCITTSKQQAEYIRNCLIQQVEESPKKELLEKTLERYGRIFIVENWEQGCALANELAPEHLELLVSDAEKFLPKLVNAGAIFVGPYSSEPVGDYFAGPNHVLPTNGSGRFFSPLGVYDFYKRTSYIRYSEQAMQKHGKKIAALAEAEGFIHHAAAVKKRL